jgi:uncharacterized protein YjiS (DUF1127 family)
MTYIRTGVNSSGQGGAKIDIDFFKVNFYQPVQDLPFNCEAMKAKICYARYVVETLRRYNNYSLTTPALNAYLSKTYYELLDEIGLPYDELRLIRVSSPAEKEKMAKKLGLFYNSSNDIFNSLYLNTGGSGLNLLSEDNLERAFGLIATNKAREIFSSGVKFGDHTTTPQVLVWYVKGYELKRNTDASGNIYLRLRRVPISSVDTTIVELYKVQGSTNEVDLVASGSMASTSGTIQLLEKNLSGISGYIKVAYTSNTTAIYFNCIPAVLASKLNRQSSIWMESDELYPSLPTPIIEPDLISLDDLRFPFSGVEGSPAALLYARMDEVDTKENALVSLRVEQSGDEEIEVGVDASIPTDISVDASKYLYVVMQDDAQIKVFNPDGDLYTTIGSDISTPSGVHVTDKIYMTDYGDSLLKCFTKGLSPALSWQFGQTGSSINVLNQPYSVAVNGNDIWVSDMGNGRILNYQFSETFNNLNDNALRGASTLIQDFNASSYEVFPEANKLVKKDASGKVVWAIGRKDEEGDFIAGSKEGEFNNPTLVALVNGYLYVKDEGNSRIQKINPDGSFIDDFPLAGSSTQNMYINAPSDVRIDQSGNKYILNTGTHNLIKTDASGIFIWAIGKPDGTSGSGIGELNAPQGIDVALDGTIYIADTGNHRILVYSAEGSYLQTWGGGGSGSSNSKFNTPVSVSLDVSGYSGLGQELVYIADKNNNRVQVFNRAGEYISTMGSGLTPVYVCTDCNRKLYVADSGSSTVKVYTPGNNTPVSISNFGTLVNTGGFTFKGLAISAENLLHITVQKSTKSYIVKLDSSYGFVYEYGGNPFISVGSGFTNTFRGFCIDSSGMVHVADADLIRQFNLPGAYVTTGCTPFGLSVDKNGNVFVTTDQEVMLMLNRQKEWKQLPVGVSTVRCAADNQGFVHASSGSQVITIDYTGNIASQRTLADVQGQAVDNNGKLYSLYLNTENGKRFVYVANLNKGLFSIVNEIFGTPFELSYETFFDLAREEKNGTDINERLSTLHLNYETYKHITRLCEIFRSGQDISEEEWQTIYDILINSWKRKVKYPVWIQAEAGEISLSPEQFKLLNNVEEQAVVLNEWRVTLKERKEWRNLLTERSDERTSLESAYTEAGITMEEQAMTRLRDAIINEIVISGVTSFRGKADWLNKRLFIDTLNNCCRKTTRISESINLVLGVFTSIRYGTLKSIFPSLACTINDESFDDQWRWMGSYETWRSAMFVHFYPENLLLPSFRSKSSVKFRQLADEVLSNEQFSPFEANNVMDSYKAYAKDISSLVVKASCINITSIREEKIENGVVKTSVSERGMTYVFAQSTLTKKVYWMLYDKDKPHDIAPSDWTCLEQLNSIEELLGVTNVSLNENSRRVCLLLKVKKDDKFKIASFGFDTQNLEWDNQYTELTSNFEFLTENGNFTYTQCGQSWSGPNPIQLPTFALLKDGYINIGQIDFSSDKINYIRNISINITQTRMVQELVSEGVYNAKYGIGIERKVLRSVPKTITTPTHVHCDVVHSLLLTYDNGKYGFKLIYQTGTFIGTLSIPVTGLATGIAQETKLTGLSAGAVFMGASPDFGTNSILTFWQQPNSPQIVGKYVTFSASGVATVGAMYTNMVLDYPIIMSYSPIPQNGVNNTYPCVMSKYRGCITIAYINMKRSPSLVASVDDSRMISPKIQAIDTIKPDYNWKSASPNLIGFASYINLTSYENKGVFQKTFVEESFYHMPMMIALQLQKNGYFKEALDWYNMIYIYTNPSSQRKIYYGLTLEETLTNSFERGTSWLKNYMDPHSIAAMRTNSYTRFTVSSIARCLIEFADQQFTKDTAETVPNAQRMYSEALELLRSSNIIKSPLETACGSIVSQLDVKDTLFAAVTYSPWFNSWKELKERASKVSGQTSLQALVNDIKTTMGTSFSSVTDLRQKMTNVSEKIGNAISAQVRSAITSKLENVTNRADLDRKLAVNVVLQNPTIATQAKQVAAAKTAVFTAAVSAVTNIVTSTLKTGTVAYPSMMALSVDPVTVPFRAEFLRFNAAPVSNVMPAISINIENTIKVNNTKTVSPVNFKAGVLETLPFHTLKPNTPALNNQAALANVGKAVAGDSGTYSDKILKLSYSFCVPSNPVGEIYAYYAEMNLYKIRNCLNIAGIKRELDPYAAATDTTTGLPYIGIGGQINGLSNTNYLPSQYRFEFLLERAKQLTSLAQQMENGMIMAIEKFDNERFILQNTKQQFELSKANINLGAIRTRLAQGEVKLANLQLDKATFQYKHYNSLVNRGELAYESMSLSMLAISSSMLGLASRLPSSVSVSGAPGVAYSPSGSLSSIASSISTMASYYAQQASYQRRAEEWAFMRDIALKDIGISRQQVAQAETGLQIAGQEYRIAELQAEHNRDVITFLEEKFFNVEMYNWMGTQLGNIYRYFLNQATSVAVQAQNQLAFERQELPTQLIEADYWTPPANPADMINKDRRGIMGAERLLQDIYMLEQRSLDTDKRKHQLSKTFSLAKLAPVEFQQFLETGEIEFATLMEYFDRDFPGHYLRLVKQVKTSVIALIPPIEGIKATLSSSGLSKVVTQGGGSYQTITIKNKLPEKVALSSAMNATGVFEMQPTQTDKRLNAFEGMGVESDWIFSMPKASNPFDYNTISDVLITIDYTSLDSFEYRQQVISQLDTDIRGRRAYSMKFNFPDQWYDLSSQISVNTPCTIKLRIESTDFPANLTESPLISQVSFYFSKSGKKKFNEFEISDFSFKPDSSTTTFTGSGGESNNGLISSISGQGEWANILAKDAAGELTLTFPNTKGFRDETISDLIIMITYSSELHPYPTL